MLCPRATEQSSSVVCTKLDYLVLDWPRGEQRDASSLSLTNQTRTGDCVARHLDTSLAQSCFSLAAIWLWWLWFVAVVGRQQDRNVTLPLQSVNCTGPLPPACLSSVSQVTGVVNPPQVSATVIASLNVRVLD